MGLQPPPSAPLGRCQVHTPSSPSHSERSFVTPAHWQRSPAKPFLEGPSEILGKSSLSSRTTAARNSLCGVVARGAGAAFSACVRAHAVWLERGQQKFLFFFKSTWATQQAWTFTLSVGWGGQGNCCIKPSLLDMPIAFTFPEQLRGLHSTVRECKPDTGMLTDWLCYTGLGWPTQFSESHDFFFPNTCLVWEALVPLSSHAPSPSLQTRNELQRPTGSTSGVWGPLLLPRPWTVGPRGQVS